VKCEVGKGDGVRDQQQSRRSHGQARALAVQCWHRCSRVWGGPAAARLSRLHERSHTVPGDAADRVQFSAFSPIILSLLFSSVLALRDGMTEHHLLCFFCLIRWTIKIVSICSSESSNLRTRADHSNKHAQLYVVMVVVVMRSKELNEQTLRIDNILAIHSLCISDSLPWQ
jgi:hypothetical protein